MAFVKDGCFCIKKNKIYIDTKEMKNRIQNEIEHGKFLIKEGAGETWNWETPAGKLRWRRRVKMLTDHLLPGMKVLELGCGTGYFTREITRKNVDLTAIDISPDLLQEAKRNIVSNKIIFALENAYSMNFSNCSFDTVVGSSVLHHLDIRQALSEIYRVLRPCGTACFTEPNMLNPQIAIQKNIQWVKRISGDSPDETAFILWQLENKMKKTGFVNIMIKPFDFLHPRIPEMIIPVVEDFCLKLEEIPLFRQIAGSLYIKAEKPKDATQ